MRRATAADLPAVREVVTAARQQGDGALGPAGRAEILGLALRSLQAPQFS